MIRKWHACIDCGKERWIEYVKGEPVANLCRSCSLKRRHKSMPDLCRGANNPNWKGGIRRPRKDGYIAIRLEPDNFFYPMTNKQHLVLEHRLVVAKALKRCLLSWETVHHKEGYARNDNRYPQTLELLPDRYKHDALTRMANYVRKLEREIERLKIQLQIK